MEKDADDRTSTTESKMNLLIIMKFYRYTKLIIFKSFIIFTA